MLLLKIARWKNFLSTGNYWNELRLDEHATTLIIGANGDGKSTFLDAVSFGLYGKPFRNVTKNQLVNSINQKGASVEIEFHKEGHDYLVRRGIKPGVFEIYKDGVLVPQDASVKDYQEILERDILRMDHRSFCQVVTLGSASFVPFMQLPAGHRREFIEDLLDIKVFSAMGRVLKSRMDENKAALLDLKKDRDNLSGNLHQISSDLGRLKARNEKAREGTAAEIRALKDELETIRQTYEKALSDIARLTPLVSDQERVQVDKSAAQAEVVLLTDTIRRLNTEAEFFSKSDSCPTCTQPMHREFAHAETQKRLAEIRKYSLQRDVLSKEIRSLNDRLNELSVTAEEINGHVQTKYISMVKAEETAKRIKELQKPTVTEDDELILHGRLVETETLLADKEASVVSAQESRKLMDAAALLLKDGGIKTHIVRQYVPLINRLVNRYLEDMDFFIQFELDEEFNESIKSRFRDVFSYASFSEGEKLRIDLALLFTWRDIAKIRNSASCNLLVMDEILDSSLDSVEELIKVLKHMTQGTNIFIISHRGDQLIDKFNSVVRFQKDGYFSRKVE